jgi:hypothetical protein
MEMEKNVAVEKQPHACSGSFWAETWMMDGIAYVSNYSKYATEEANFGENKLSILHFLSLWHGNLLPIFSRELRIVHNCSFKQVSCWVRGGRGSIFRLSIDSMIVFAQDKMLRYAFSETKHSRARLNLFLSQPQDAEQLLADYL